MLTVTGPPVIFCALEYYPATVVLQNGLRRDSDYSIVDSLAHTGTMEQFRECNIEFELCVIGSVHSQ